MENKFKLDTDTPEIISMLMAYVDANVITDQEISEQIQIMYIRYQSIYKLPSNEQMKLYNIVKKSLSNIIDYARINIAKKTKIHWNKNREVNGATN